MKRLKWVDSRYFYYSETNIMILKKTGMQHPTPFWRFKPGTVEKNESTISPPEEITLSWASYVSNDYSDHHSIYLLAIVVQFWYDAGWMIETNVYYHVWENFPYNR